MTMIIRNPIRSFVRPSSTQTLLTAGVLAALAVPAAAQLQFEELPRKGLPVDSETTFAVALGDVDGDGDLDMVIGNFGLSNSQNRLYLNNGTGTFSDATVSQMPVNDDSTRSVALGDVDGDGDLDMVVMNTGWLMQQNRLYLNNGTGTFTDVTASQMPVDSGSAVALGDVDGDGDLDMVIGRGGQNRLYLNNGTGTFSDATASQMPVDNDVTSSVALGDVDGDGDLDMLIGNSYYGQQNRLYLNNGTGTFSDATASQMPVDSDSTRSVALGDVDGDGDLDLVLGNSYYYSSGQNRLYLNNGTGTFSDATATQMPLSQFDFTFLVALADLDGDGDLDLIADGARSIQYISQIAPVPSRLYLNDGSGNFVQAPSTRINTGGATAAVAVGDVDGDGDLDLIQGNFGTNYSSAQNRLYLNLQRQLHAEAAPQIGQPYTIDAYLRYGPPSTVDLAAIYLSTAPASVPLGALGTLGIDPAQAAPFPTLIIPQPAGVGSVGFTVPNQPSLVGQELYSQAMLVAYPDDLRLSNVVRDVIQ